MPLDFYAGSKSMAELATESGVDHCPAALTVPSLSPYIEAHPEVVEGWLRWSDKPCANTWFFERRGSGFTVFYYPNGEELKFNEPALACAEFVVREVKGILARRRGWPRALWPF
jgi:hypothetical protein